jgi:hypothetical protein
MSQPLSKKAPYNYPNMVGALGAPDSLKTSSTKRTTVSLRSRVKAKQSELKKIAKNIIINLKF